MPLTRRELRILILALSKYKIAMHGQRKSNLVSEADIEEAEALFNKLSERYKNLMTLAVKRK